MYLVVWTATRWVGYGAQLTTVHGAQTLDTLVDVKRLSKKLWSQNFETTWFRFVNGTAVILTDEEFTAIDRLTVED